MPGVIRRATDNEGKPAQRSKVLGGLFSTSERHSPSGPFRIAPHRDTMIHRFGLYPIVSGRLSSPEATGCGTGRPGAESSIHIWLNRPSASLDSGAGAIRVRTYSDPLGEDRRTHEVTKRNISRCPRGGSARRRRLRLEQQQQQ